MTENITYSQPQRPKQLTVGEFLVLGESKFGSNTKKWKFKCPRCGTIQTAEDFVDANVSKDKIGSYLGFSCIGRFTKKKGCDWTLGGLLHIHTLEVISENGVINPYFEFA